MHYLELDQFVGPDWLVTVLGPLNPLVVPEAAVAETRTDTKMTIAAERLAVIASVTLPVTALSSILGMIVIVIDRTHLASLVVLLAIMAVMSGALLLWSKRKGWW